MDWIQLLVLMATMIGTVLGIVIPLHIHSQNMIKTIHDDMKNFNDQMNKIRSDMYNESKDFHGRLVAIEERNKPKIL